MCMAIFKMLVGERATMDDLREADPIFERSLAWMLTNDVEGVVEENFTYV